MLGGHEPGWVDDSPRPAPLCLSRALTALTLSCVLSRCFGALGSLKYGGHHVLRQEAFECADRL